MPKWSQSLLAVLRAFGPREPFADVFWSEYKDALDNVAELNNGLARYLSRQYLLKMEVEREAAAKGVSAEEVLQDSEHLGHSWKVLYLQAEVIRYLVDQYKAQLHGFVDKYRSYTSYGHSVMFAGEFKKKYNEDLKTKMWRIEAGFGRLIDRLALTIHEAVNSGNTRKLQAGLRRLLLPDSEIQKFIQHVGYTPSELFHYDAEKLAAERALHLEKAKQQYLAKLRQEAASVDNESGTSRASQGESPTAENAGAISGLRGHETHPALSGGEVESTEPASHLSPRTGQGQLTPAEQDSTKKASSRAVPARTRPLSPGRYSVFISYSHKDGEMLSRLKTHLEPFIRDEDIAVWDDTKLKGGEKWRDEIRRAMEMAGVAVLLVSPDFFASEFITANELPPLLEAADKDGTAILSVFVKPCSKVQIKKISRYQAMNKPSKTLAEMKPAQRDRIFSELAERIVEILGDGESRR